MKNLLDCYEQRLAELKAVRKAVLKEYRHLTLAEIIKRAQKEQEACKAYQDHNGHYDDRTFEDYLESELKTSAYILIGLENKTDTYTSQIKALEATIKRVKKEYYE